VTATKAEIPLCTRRAVAENVSDDRGPGDAGSHFSLLGNLDRPSDPAPGARDVMGDIAKFTPPTISQRPSLRGNRFEQGRRVRTSVLTTQPQVFTPGVISNTTLPSCREIRATSTGDVITVNVTQLGAGLRSSAWTVTKSSVFDALVSRTS
jgi:hypothetical protein